MLWCWEKDKNGALYMMEDLAARMAAEPALRVWKPLGAGQGFLALRSAPADRATDETSCIPIAENSGEGALLFMAEYASWGGRARIDVDLWRACGYCFAQMKAPGHPVATAGALVEGGWPELFAGKLAAYGAELRWMRRGAPDAAFAPGSPRPPPAVHHLHAGSVLPYSAVARGHKKEYRAAGNRMLQDAWQLSILPTVAGGVP